MKYSVNKNKTYQNALIEPKKIRGYKVNPKNNVTYEGVKVDEMIIINPSFVEKILRRKNKKKLEEYLEFIIDMLDNEDGTDTNPGKISMVLNDLERYKSIVKNNYRIYLDKLYYDLLMKKINVIEKELKIKKMYLEMTYQAMQQDGYSNEQEYEEKSRKSR